MSKFELITQNTEEVITEEDLRAFLDSGQELNHYIGFEISGQVHLGTGIVSLQKVKDFVDAGVKCKILLADWHTWINDKLGGDRTIIKKIAQGYFKEALIASFRSLGGNPDQLEFIFGADLYAHNQNYWESVIEVAKNITLSRAKRSISIMGRREGESIDLAKLIYPAMQVADLFTLGAHIAHAGLDQRKAHVIARSVADQMEISPLMLGERKVKPVAVHHHLLLGLQKPAVWPLPESANLQDIKAQAKMSKSKPGSAVFVHDSADDIRSKIKAAFCPEKVVEFNPIVDWVEHLIFARESSITIKREEIHGGDLVLGDVQEFKRSYASGKLHPVDLKNFVAQYLIDMLEPVRQHFSQGAPKAMLGELKRLIKP